MACLHRRASHAFAFFRAAFAFLSTTLAVRDFVLAAFFGARVTRLGTDPAYLECKFRIRRHEQRRSAAEHGAIAVKRDAARHHLHVVFAQALGRAPGAFVCAMVASLDAVHEFRVCHETSFAVRTLAQFFAGANENPGGLLRRSGFQFDH
jgi:hypothetical protein